MVGVRITRRRTNGDGGDVRSGGQDLYHGGGGGGGGDAWRVECKRWMREREREGDGWKRENGYAHRSFTPRHLLCCLPKHNRRSTN